MKKLSFFDKLKNSAKNKPSLVSRPSIKSSDVDNTSQSIEKSTTVNKGLQQSGALNKSKNGNNSQNYSSMNSSNKKNQGILNPFKSKFGYIEDKEEHDNDSFDNMIDKENFKDLIENASPDQKVLNLIDDTLELLDQESGDSYSLPEETTEKYELIEKSELERIKSDNDALRIRKTNRTEEFYQMANDFQKTKMELNVMNKTFSNEERSKSDFINKIYQLQDTLNEVLVQNSKIEEMIDKEKVEKENIYRALIHFQNKSSYKIPDGLKEIYARLSYGKDYYSKPYNVNSSEKIETLKLRIENLEKTLKSKNEEIQKKRHILKENR
jgi:hypothetical protein